MSHLAPSEIKISSAAMVAGAGLVVIFGDGVAEEFVPLFRSVAAKCFPLGHFVDGFVHRLHDAVGSGSVTSRSHADNFGCGLFLAKTATRRAISGKR